MSAAKKSYANGYILAGGKSSRIGMDKGLLMLNGKTIVEQVIEHLQPVVNKLVLVTSNPIYSKFGLEIVSDRIKDAGPAGGIHAALLHSDTQQNMIVSCDMPFINARGAAHMLKNAGQNLITVPFHAGGKEPLFAVYSRECTNRWEYLLQQGEVKLQRMITHFNPNYVDIRENNYFGSHFFTNINTIQDLESALQYNHNGN